MFNRNDLEKIKKIIEEFFEKMTIEAEVEVFPMRESTSVFDGKEEKVFSLPVNVRAEEPQILIGERGQTLLEIQHLLKAILKKKIAEPFFLDLDINDYKKKKSDYLKEMARNLADEVALSKKEKWLSSMPSYERRIIHMELSKRDDISTESVGEEPDRKIVIKPRF